MSKIITFYNPQHAYGEFSNFSRHPIEIRGRAWTTTEHYYQAMKFSPHNPERVELVRRAERPRIAAQMGRDPLHPIRLDWELSPPTEWLEVLPPDQSDVRDGILREVEEPLFVRTKDCVMFEAVYTKFTQYPHLMVKLLNTRGHILLEDSPRDAYWGVGLDRTGHNKLGRILMKVRTELLRGLARSER